MKIFRYLEDSGLLIKQKGEVLNMLLCALVATLLENLLTPKWVMAKIHAQGIMIIIIIIIIIIKEYWKSND